MELIQHRPRRLRLPPFAIPEQRALYLALMVRLLLGVMGIVAGEMALTRLMPLPAHPFAAYEGLISGDTHDPAFWSNYETLFSAAYELVLSHFGHEA